jgi:hypothetical protein
MCEIGGSGDIVVGLFGDKPAARPQCRNHAPQGVGRIVEVHQQEPTVDEVIGLALEIIDSDVTAAHLDIGFR